MYKPFLNEPNTMILLAHLHFVAKFVLCLYFLWLISRASQRPISTFGPFGIRIYSCSTFLRRLSSFFSILSFLTFNARNLVPYKLDLVADKVPEVFKFFNFWVPGACFRYFPYFYAAKKVQKGTQFWA